MTTLYLIRHATNDSLKKGILPGWLPGIHLNEEGRRQAEQMAARMSQVKLDAIYSSPLERAIETAEYLAQPRNLAISVRDDLGEIRVGHWQGQKTDELNKTDEWKKFQVYPSGARFPGGEAGWELQARLVQQVEAIRAEHPEGAVALVGHADTIKPIVAFYVGLHLDLFQRLVVSPASVTVLWLGPWGPRLIRFNDAGPLEEFKPPMQSEPKEKETEHAEPGV